MNNYKEKLIKEGYAIIPASNEIINIVDRLNDELDNIGKFYIPNFHRNNPEHTLRANLRGYFKVIRTSPFQLYEIASSKTIRLLLNDLGIKFPVVHGCNVRVDVKEESKHQFGWHQDAISLLGSKSMYTYWIPLGEVSKTMGSLQIIPGSHSRGIYPVKARDPDLADESKSSNLIISSEINQEDSKIIEAKPGTIIVLHPLLIHRSYYPDQSHPPRRTVLLRVDELDDVEHRNRGYKTSVNGYNLINSPEYESYYKN